MPVAKCSPRPKNSKAASSAALGSAGTMSAARSLLPEKDLARPSNLEIRSWVCRERSAANSEDIPSPEKGGKWLSSPLIERLKE